jgi:hypothetical protein
LQADVDWIFAQVIDVFLEVGVGVDGESRAGVLDDADVDSAVFTELESLVDCEGVAEVDVVVGDGEGWFRGSRCGDVKIRTSRAKSAREMGHPPSASLTTTHG